MRMGSGARPDRGGWPLGLFGMIALAVAVEASVALREGELRGVVHWDWRLAVRVARGREAIGAKVLCFGDSPVKYAVQPRVLGDQLGGRPYNLAILAGLAPSSFFLLQHALGAGARPSVAVVDFAPTTLEASPSLEAGNWSELLSPGEAIDLARSARDFELFGAIMARLHCRGALALSDDLAPIIDRLVSGGDASLWVAMPKARAQPSGLADEGSDPRCVARNPPASARR